MNRIVENNQQTTSKIRMNEDAVSCNNCGSLSFETTVRAEQPGTLLTAGPDELEFEGSLPHLEQVDDKVTCRGCNETYRCEDGELVPVEDSEDVATVEVPQAPLERVLEFVDESPALDHAPDNSVYVRALNVVAEQAEVETRFTKEQ